MHTHKEEEEEEVEEEDIQQATREILSSRVCRIAQSRAEQSQRQIHLFRLLLPLSLLLLLPLPLLQGLPLLTNETLKVRVVKSVDTRGHTLKLSKLLPSQTSHMSYNYRVSLSSPESATCEIPCTSLSSLSLWALSSRALLSWNSACALLSLSCQAASSRRLEGGREGKRGRGRGREEK